MEWKCLGDRLEELHGRKELHRDREGRKDLELGRHATPKAGTTVMDRKVLSGA